MSLDLSVPHQTPLHQWFHLGHCSTLWLYRGHSSVSLLCLSCCSSYLLCYRCHLTSLLWVLCVPQPLKRFLTPPANLMGNNLLDIDPHFGHAEIFTLWWLLFRSSWSADLAPCLTNAEDWAKWRTLHLQVAVLRVAGPKDLLPSGPTVYFFNSPCWQSGTMWKKSWGSDMVAPKVCCTLSSSATQKINRRITWSLAPEAHTALFFYHYSQTYSLVYLCLPCFDRSYILIVFAVLFLPVLWVKLTRSALASASPQITRHFFRKQLIRKPT